MLAVEIMLLYFLLSRLSYFQKRVKYHVIWFLSSFVCVTVSQRQSSLFFVSFHLSSVHLDFTFPSQIDILYTEKITSVGSPWHSTLLVCQRHRNKNQAYFSVTCGKYLTNIHGIEFRNSTRQPEISPVCSLPALNEMRELRNLVPFSSPSVGNHTLKQITEFGICCLSVVTNKRCFVFLRIYRRKLKPKMFLSSGRTILKLSMKLYGDCYCPSHVYLSSI